MASQQRRQLTPAERTELAVKQTTRMLSANVNSAYTQPSSSFMKRPSETWAEYTPKYTPVDKSRHLQKDDIKTCVRLRTRLLQFSPYELTHVSRAPLSGMLRRRSPCTMSGKGCLWLPRPSGHRNRRRERDEQRAICTVLPYRLFRRRATCDTD